MSNYPTAPGVQCDGYDRVNGGYPMRRCLADAVMIITIKDGSNFCHSRKVCKNHATALLKQAMIEILNIEPVNQSESIPFDGVAPDGSPVGELGEKGI